jgi:hypothetical protein
VQEIEDELQRRDRALLPGTGDERAALPRGDRRARSRTTVGEIRVGKDGLAIETYREKYGIADVKRALGGKSQGIKQRLAKERIEASIEERAGRSRDDDLGIERSQELTP